MEMEMEMEMETETEMEMEMEMAMVCVAHARSGVQSRRNCALIVPHRTSRSQYCYYLQNHGVFGERRLRGWGPLQTLLPSSRVVSSTRAYCQCADAQVSICRSLRR